jgi:hypothetical protein
MKIVSRSHLMDIEHQLKGPYLVYSSYKKMFCRSIISPQFWVKTFDMTESASSKFYICAIESRIIFVGIWSWEGTILKRINFRLKGKQSFPTTLRNTCILKLEFSLEISRPNSAWTKNNSHFLVRLYSMKQFLLLSSCKLNS